MIENNYSVQAPSDVAPVVDQGAAKNQMLANMLRQQMAPQQQQTAQGWAIPQSPLSNIGQIAGNIGSQYMMTKTGA